MPDWTKTMEQSYEYYTVDPTTLADLKRLDNVKSASFTRDADTETLGSASIAANNSVGETYIRGYLKTRQNGVTEKFPLGTVLVQTPSSSFDGKIMDISMDAYTPLIELKENKPPIGYTLRKGTNIMDAAYNIIREHARVPVNQVEHVYEKDSNGVLQDISPVISYENGFISNTDDTWLSFVIDLIALAKYELGLDEKGHILFLPVQDMAALQPVWTYDDGNSSILLPDITIDHDLYGIPNRVEVIHSYGGQYLTAIATNEDENSPVSYKNRGRWITYRDTNPKLSVNNDDNVFVSQERLNEYAENLLHKLSTIEYSVSYTHAYCPVRVGDCVRLNYEKAGITNIKAKVISQNIKCDLPCQVSEKAIFTTNLWR